MRLLTLVLGLLLLVCNAAIAGKLEIAPLFGNRMVLQKGNNTAISGTASPGAGITVSFNGKSEKIKADATGKWRVRLKCDRYGGPHKMIIAGDGSKIFFNDIMIGEVWLCAGQSNMAMPAGSSLNWSAIAEKIHNKNIRFLKVFEKNGYQWGPQSRVKGSWWALKNPKGYRHNSAVGMSFAFDLYNKLKIPVGIIQNARGGVPISTYMSMEKLKSKPEYAHVFKDIEKKKAKADEYEKAKKKWEADKKTAVAAGKKAPKRPRMHHWCRKSAWPTMIFNNMTWPMKDYNIRGVIWYQGESDSGHPEPYKSMLPDMMAEFRQIWNNPDMYFMIVQLALVNGREIKGPVDVPWSRLMEVQQIIAENDSKAEIVATYDLPVKGDDIHYKNKFPIGNRLLRVALDKVYGQKNIYSGPRFKNIRIDGNKVTVEFLHTANGLKTKAGGISVGGFTIAGSDRKFVPAQAEIKGDKVMVWNDNVASPVAVRYAWADKRCGANLCNSADLPAFPFRSDKWDITK